MVRVEAGLILIEADYTSVRHAVIDEQATRRSRSAWAGSWTSRSRRLRGPARARAETAAGGPARRLVGLELDWDGIEGLFADAGLPPHVQAEASRDPIPLYAGAARIERRLETRYLDEATESLDDALSRVRAAQGDGRGLSVGLLGNAADVVPELARRGEAFDLVTDQTAAHDPLTGYVPQGLDVAAAAELRTADPVTYLERARAGIATHVRGLLEFVRAGSYVFDYGNNLRGEALEAGVEDAFTYPGFVPAISRPLSAAGSDHSGGPSSRATRRTFPRSTRHCESCSLRTASCSGGWSWLPSGWHSRVCLPGSAGLATAIVRKRASRSTSSSAADACRRRW